MTIRLHVREIVLFVLLLLALPLAYTLGQGDGEDTINACVDETGRLRILLEDSDPCNEKESPLAVVV